MGAQKNSLIETVLLSTHNICFGGKVRKLFFLLLTLFLSTLTICFGLEIRKLIFKLAWFRQMFRKLYLFFASFFA